MVSRKINKRSKTAYEDKTVRGHTVYFCCVNKENMCECWSSSCKHQKLIYSIDHTFAVKTSPSKKDSRDIKLRRSLLEYYLTG